MEEEKFTNCELALLEKALRLYYNVTADIDKMPDNYGDYHIGVYELSIKLSKIFNYSFDVLH